MINVISPKSRFINPQSLLPDEEYIRWEQDEGFQVAYEILYKMKSDEEWSSTGKIESAEACHSTLFLYNATKRPFEEVYYKVKVYIESHNQNSQDNAFSMATGTITSVTYSIVFKSDTQIATMNTMSQDNKKVTSPLFEDVQNRNIEVMNFALDSDKVVQLPLVDSDSPISGDIEVKTKQGVKKLIGYGHFPDHVESEGDYELEKFAYYSKNYLSYAYASRNDISNYTTNYAYKYQSSNEVNTAYKYAYGTRYDRVDSYVYSYMSSVDFQTNSYDSYYAQSYRSEVISSTGYNEKYAYPSGSKQYISGNYKYQYYIPSYNYETTYVDSNGITIFQPITTREYYAYKFDAAYRYIPEQYLYGTYYNNANYYYLKNSSYYYLVTSEDIKINYLYATGYTSNVAYNYQYNYLYIISNIYRYDRMKYDKTMYDYSTTNYKISSYYKYTDFYYTYGYNTSTNQVRITDYTTRSEHSYYYTTYKSVKDTKSQVTGYYPYQNMYCYIYAPSRYAAKPAYGIGYDNWHYYYYDGTYYVSSYTSYSRFTYERFGGYAYLISYYYYYYYAIANTGVGSDVYYYYYSVSGYHYIYTYTQTQYRGYYEYTVSGANYSTYYTDVYKYYGYNYQYQGTANYSYNYISGYTVNYFRNNYLYLTADVRDVYKYYLHSTGGGIIDNTYVYGYERYIGLTGYRDDSYYYLDKYICYNTAYYYYGNEYVINRYGVDLTFSYPYYQYIYSDGYNNTKIKMGYGYYYYDGSYRITISVLPSDPGSYTYYYYYTNYLSMTLYNYSSNTYYSDYVYATGVAGGLVSNKALADQRYYYQYSYTTVQDTKQNQVQEQTYLADYKYGYYYYIEASGYYTTYVYNAATAISVIGIAVVKSGTHPGSGYAGPYSNGPRYSIASSISSIYAYYSYSYVPVQAILISRYILGYYVSYLYNTSRYTYNINIAYNYYYNGYYYQLKTTNIDLSSLSYYAYFYDSTLPVNNGYGYIKSKSIGLYNYYEYYYRLNAAYYISVTTYYNAYTQTGGGYGTATLVPYNVTNYVEKYDRTYQYYYYYYGYRYSYNYSYYYYYRSVQTVVPYLEGRQGYSAVYGTVTQYSPVYDSDLYKTYSYRL